MLTCGLHIYEQAHTCMYSCTYMYTHLHRHTYVTHMHTKMQGWQNHELRTVMYDFMISGQILKSGSGRSASVGAKPCLFSMNIWRLAFLTSNSIIELALSLNWDEKREKSWNHQASYCVSLIL